MWKRTKCLVASTAADPHVTYPQAGGLATNVVCGIRDGSDLRPGTSVLDISIACKVSLLLFPPLRLKDHGHSLMPPR